jgi:methylmalonyl-CoA/ethylmalonyl-CoA epimerase
MSTLNISAQTGLSSMRLDHIMLSVPNYEETMEWYREKLDT